MPLFILKGKNEVAFRPFGLDVPDELGNACKQVKAVLDAEKQQRQAVRNAIFTTPPWKATTAVGKTLAALTHASDVTRIEALATLSDQEQSRLTRLTEDLSKNPATAAAEQTLRADRIKRLGEALAVIAAQTTDEFSAACWSCIETRRRSGRRPGWPRRDYSEPGLPPRCGRGGMANTVGSGPSLFDRNRLSSRAHSRPLGPICSACYASNFSLRRLSSA